MAELTLNLSDELLEQLIPLRDRLPELLQSWLRQPPLPAEVYRYILTFLAKNPSAAELLAFRPTEAMGDRLRVLVERDRSGTITPAEVAELNEYEQIEHLIVMLKKGALAYLTREADL